MDERAEDVDLIEDLAVGVVEAFAQECGAEVLEQIDRRVVVVAGFRAPRVARRAQLDLLAGGDAAGRHHEPVFR